MLPSPVHKNSQSRHQPVDEPPTNSLKLQGNKTSASHVSAIDPCFNDVVQRSDALIKIRQDLQDLSIAFQQLDDSVMEQEPQVEDVERISEQVADDAILADQDLEIACRTAHNQRRVKWSAFALLICFLMVAVALGIILYQQQKA